MTSHTGVLLTRQSVSLSVCLFHLAFSRALTTFDTVCTRTLWQQTPNAQWNSLVVLYTTHEGLLDSQQLTRELWVLAVSGEVQVQPATNEQPRETYIVWLANVLRKHFCRYELQCVWVQLKINTLYLVKTSSVNGCVVWFVRERRVKLRSEQETLFGYHNPILMIVSSGKGCYTHKETA